MTDSVKDYRWNNMKDGFIDYGSSSLIVLTEHGLKVQDEYTKESCYEVLPAHIEDIGNYAYVTGNILMLEKIFYHEGQVKVLTNIRTAHDSELKRFLIEMYNETQLSLYEMFVIYQQL